MTDKTQGGYLIVDLEDENIYDTLYELCVKKKEDKPLLIKHHSIYKDIFISISDIIATYDSYLESWKFVIPITGSKFNEYLNKSKTDYYREVSQERVSISRDTFYYEPRNIIQTYGEVLSVYTDTKSFQTGVIARTNKSYLNSPKISGYRLGIFDTVENKMYMTDILPIAHTTDWFSDTDKYGVPFIKDIAEGKIYSYDATKNGERYSIDLSTRTKTKYKVVTEYSDDYYTSSIEEV